jgi:predicted transposase
MKQTMVITLAPESDQPASRLRTLETFNAACNDRAAVACAERCASKVDLQKLVYDDVRQRFGLSAQMTVRAIAQGVEAYQR